MHTAKTYLGVWPDFDRGINARFLREKTVPTDEELEIKLKAEIRREIESLGGSAEWVRHHFVIGMNTEYDVDINGMIRKTIAPWLGKEDRVRALRKKFGAEITLHIVPHIDTASEEPNPLFSLDRDIIAFLHIAEIEMDLDYYIE